MARRAGSAEPAISEAVPDRMLPAPMRPDSEAVAGRRDRAPSIAIAAYLAAVAVVAAATIGVFFGIAFALLRPPAGPAVAQPPIGAHSSGATAVAAVTATPAAVATLASEVRALPPGSGAAATPLSTAPLATALLATAPAATQKIAGPVPKAAAAIKPAARTGPPTPAAARLPGSQLAGLVARGDAFFRAGDIASARLFYERAADGGDGQAALRAGATFDPTFLASIGLRRMHGERAKALSWYRRALGLGASNAAPYLHNLETQVR